MEALLDSAVEDAVEMPKIQQRFQAAPKPKVPVARWAGNQMYMDQRRVEGGRDFDLEQRRSWRAEKVPHELPPARPPAHPSARPPVRAVRPR
jgi:hypothetical protein